MTLIWLLRQASEEVMKDIEAVERYDLGSDSCLHCESSRLFQVSVSIDMTILF